MQLELLDSFDVPTIAMPPRSRLVSLAPQGVGTANCESLISYLVRLAGAHVVRPNVLVKNIIVPLTDISLDTSMFSFCCKFSRTINSYMYYARTFSCAIQKLTLQRNLDLLTLLPWADLFDPKGSGLLRDHVAICPECLEAWSKDEQDIYYPTIWYLRAVRFCSAHGCLLEEVCSSCGQRQNFIAHHAALGYCSHCGAWLGKSGQRTTEKPVAAEISDHDRFMISAVEQMIASNGEAANFATHTNLLNRIQHYSQVLADGNIFALEQLLGFSRGAINSWVAKESRPRVDRFLELCYRLRTMPVQFLSDEVTSDAAVVSQGVRKHNPTHKTKASRETLLGIRRQLESILEGDDLVSQPAVAKALGVKLRFLLYHFPDLCSAIAQKRRARIAALAKEKRDVRVQKAKAVAEQMLTDLRPISRRKLSRALETEGLSFADAEVRGAALLVLTEHLTSCKKSP